MCSSTGLKPWKRLATSIDDHRSNSAPVHYKLSPCDEPPEFKRSRTSAAYTSDTSSEDQCSKTSVNGCPPQLEKGHTYGPATISDNAILHNGDAFYDAGPASRISGPSVLNGDMNVHLNNIFYCKDHDLSRQDSADLDERVIRSLLYYSSMDDRKAQLAKVEPASFAWIWSTGFPQWLESDEGFFWISGKPASGKSTLLHFLATNAVGSTQVQKHLAARGGKWLLVHFYFDFRAGKGIANTGLGMLRSLLMQLLDHSSQFKDHILERCRYRLDGRWPDLESELLDLIVGGISSTNVSFCGFVDGLDEYDGKLADLFSLLQRLQSKCRVKFCLASRPEPELHFRLQAYARISMQDHNRLTIDAYIEAATASIGYFVPVSQLLDVLTDVVAKHADGVILWAVFAVDEAVKASLCGSTNEEIRKSLQSYPQELCSVYRRVWSSLGDFEQRLAAVVFFVIEHWSSSFGTEANARSIDARKLTIISRLIIRKLDPSFEVDSEYTSLAFQLKIHDLLKGLVEFIGDEKYVRLAHRSVQSFLSQLPNYTDWARHISHIVDVNTFGPSLLLEVIVNTCHTLPLSIESKEDTDEYIGMSWTPDQIGKLVRISLENTRSNLPLDCAHDSISLTCSSIKEENRYWRSQFALLNDPAHIDKVRSVSKCWAIQDYLIPLMISKYGRPSRLGFPCGTVKSDHGRDSQVATNNHEVKPSIFLKDNPELIYLVSKSFCHAFEAIIGDGNALTEDDCAFLFHLVLFHWNRTPRPWPETLTAARKRILLPVIARLSRQAHIFARLLLPQQVAVVGVESVADGDDTDYILRPSVWWRFRPTHMLCLWIWNYQCKERMREELGTLLDFGISVEGQICEEGNALHALFMWKPWSCLQDPDDPPLYRFELPIKRKVRAFGHFSLDKLEILLSKGANVHASGKHGTVLQAAEKFNRSMQAWWQRRKEKSSTRCRPAEVDEAAKAVVLIEAAIKAGGHIDTSAVATTKAESCMSMV